MEIFFGPDLVEGLLVLTREALGQLRQALIRR
jgi:hypothetical protein